MTAANRTPDYSVFHHDPLEVLSHMLYVTTTMLLRVHAEGYDLDAAVDSAIRELDRIHAWFHHAQNDRDDVREAALQGRTFAYRRLDLDPAADSGWIDEVADNSERLSRKLRNGHGLPWRAIQARARQSLWDHLNAIDAAGDPSGRGRDRFDFGPAYCENADGELVPTGDDDSPFVRGGDFIFGDDEPVDPERVCHALMTASIALGEQVRRGAIDGKEVIDKLFDAAEANDVPPDVAYDMISTGMRDVSL